MLKLDQKEDCCGCTACYGSCPQGAITLEEDEEGFLYPHIDHQRCIDCGICDKVCPIANKTQGLPAPQTAFLVQNRADDVRLRSTSGAAVNAIGAYIIASGGAVYGAELSEDVVCRHCVVETVDDLKRIQGSKYVQSDVGNCFVEIRERLKNDQKILFVGMPCQVEGLKRFLGGHKDLLDKLYTIDLACYGVPSPGLFREFVDQLVSAHHKKVRNVVFRDKTYGYSASNVKVFFADGTARDCHNDVKTFTHLMFSGFSLRPSCYECQFKTVGRVSDLTLFDCALVGKYAPDLDDDKGTTSVLVHSEKGRALFQNIQILSDILVREADPGQLIKNEGTMLTTSAKRNPKRVEFFQNRTKMSYAELARKYVPVTVKTMLGNVIKTTLHFTGPVGRKLLYANKKHSIHAYQKKYSAKE